MSYAKGCSIGFWVALTSSIISNMFVLVYVSIVDLGFLEMIKENQLEKMYSQGLSQAQMQQADSWVSALTTPFAFVMFGLLGGIFTGSIIGLLVAAVTSKTESSWQG